MDVKYSCKQVQNLQPAEDIISTAEDTQYDAKTVMKLLNLFSHIKGRIQVDSVRQWGAEEDIEGLTWRK